jgi:hypothetical protein
MGDVGVNLVVSIIIIRLCVPLAVMIMVGYFGSLSGWSERSFLFKPFFLEVRTSKDRAGRWITA